MGSLHFHKNEMDLSLAADSKQDPPRKIAMKCPHCQVTIHPDFETAQLTHKSNPNIGINGRGRHLQWAISHMVCPSCHKAIFSLKGVSGPSITEFSAIVYPKSGVRLPAPPEVTLDIAEDFNEASTVFADSPKASAALSRRCLQSVLRHLGFKQHNLADAIQAALDATIFPLSLAENLDAIRGIGNFAAHPIKGTNATAIAEVEPEEAEWNLDVLEELLDFVYVQPAKSQVRRAKLNEKLAAHGKPPIAEPKASDVDATNR